MKKNHHDTPVEFIEHEAQELQREYKRFRKFRDENSLLFGVFVFGLAALIVINTVFWMHWTAQRLYDKASTHNVIVYPKVAKSLQDSRNDAVEVEVKNVQLNSKQDKAFALEEGMTMLIMNVTIKNTSKQTHELMPVNQLFVKTEVGDISKLHASMHVSSPLPASTVKPGQSVSGQVSFAVLKNTERPLLYVDTGWDDTTPLVIDVLH